MRPFARGLAGLAAAPPRPRGNETERLGGHDLGNGEAVVNLRDVHVARALARHRIGLGSSAIDDLETGQIRARMQGDGIGRRADTGHLDERALGLLGDRFGNENHGGGAVADRRAVEKTKWIGHLRRTRAPDRR